MQLVLVEAAVGVDALLVAAKVGDFRLGQILELGDADAVFAGDHAVQSRAMRMMRATAWLAVCSIA